VSAAGYGGIISLYQYIFASQYVFTTKMYPQLWRIFTAFLITKPKFGILLDPYFLYQYGSSIERESSRFSQPGDFFTYTVFVGSVIVVSTSCCMPIAQYTHTRIDTSVCDTTTTVNHLLHLPAQPCFAGAVLKTEGEYPCTSRSSVNLNQSRDCEVCRHCGMSP
jgi:hypothetical protein